ncbi:hypothetical protein PoB_002622300 [Plakobranchus ocellatus]|uniref:Uncharacterized protein n=1 Tax=Plakobranchus ocellatus TaxID=259542 RepID=A0AAV3ZZ50_9GAST|nr:hypothetical protein PoB_002622300 [Plakobranchus ocellatus]
MKTLLIAGLGAVLLLAALSYADDLTGCLHGSYEDGNHPAICESKKVLRDSRTKTLYCCEDSDNRRPVGRRLIKDGVYSYQCSCMPNAEVSFSFDNYKATTTFKRWCLHLEAFILFCDLETFGTCRLDARNDNYNDDGGGGRDRGGDGGGAGGSGAGGGDGDNDHHNDDGGGSGGGSDDDDGDDGGGGGNDDDDDSSLKTFILYPQYCRKYPLYCISILTS